MAGTPDAIVVGGGIIGLSIAWQLGRTGMTVRVLERDRVGSHASGAAAGMLAPLAESDKPGPLFDFGRTSLEMYPSYLEQLQFDSEAEVVLEGPGLLRLGFNGEEADRMKALAETEGGRKLEAKWLSDSEVEEVQAGTSPMAVGGLLSAKEQHVNPRKIMHALARACQRQRVSFMEGFQAEAAVRAIPEGVKVIYAAGAWTGEVLSGVGFMLPVRPVKGQVMILRQPEHELRYTVYGRGGYLVPRVDGSVVLGATSEEAGFDERVSTGGETELWDRAKTLYPASCEWRLEDSWASLRPGTPDDLPILGRVPGIENAFVATGHYRNGILQAPITAKLMTELILTGNEPEVLAPFTAGRFAKATVA